MFAIETKNLTKVYKTGHFWSTKVQKALDDLSLQIPKSQVFGILGLNGAGKTTLMKILLGIIRQTSGVAVVLDMPAGDILTHNKIAYLPEIPYFSKYLTPMEILNFYAQLFGIPKKILNKNVNML